MKKNEHVVKDIVPGSIAEELEIEPGDILLKINKSYKKNMERYV